MAYRQRRLFPSADGAAADALAAPVETCADKNGKLWGRNSGDTGCESAAIRANLCLHAGTSDGWRDFDAAQLLLISHHFQMHVKVFQVLCDLPRLLFIKYDHWSQYNRIKHWDCAYNPFFVIAAEIYLYHWYYLCLLSPLENHFPNWNWG